MNDRSEIGKAAQGLLDINQSRNDKRANRGKEISKGAGYSHLSAATPANIQESGQTITSGDFTSNSRSADINPQESVKRGIFREPSPRRPDRVVILKKAEKGDDQRGGELGSEPGLADAMAELPVPTSAFAFLKGGESAKSSDDLSPFYSSVAVKEGLGSEGESGSQDLGDQEGEDEGVRRPSKRRKLTRTVSINTILQRVGSKEEPLADVIGTAPQTVEDIVALQNTLASQGEPGKTHTLKIEESPIRASLPRPRGPSLPPRKSSDQSTVDQHRQLALQDSSNTVEMEMAARRSGQKGVTREFSVERDLHHQPPKRKASTYSGMGMVVETGAPPTGPQSTPSTKEAGEADTKVVIWSGKIKHRLKTADCASTVELFSVSALVPEKLLEQMPSTLFVSALAGRANVRLGKHYVTQCRLENLEEKQMQKVLALASMKLVAICELQHCTLTLVPFSDARQGLRMVGFMIADD